MEKTIGESPYCMDLDPNSRPRHQHLVKIICQTSPVLMKMIEYRQNLKISKQSNMSASRTIL